MSKKVPKIEQLSIREQMNVIRYGIVHLLRKKIKELELPIQIDDSKIHTDQGNVWVKISLPYKDNYATKVFKGMENIDKDERDPSGKKLYNGLCLLNLHTEEFVNALIEANKEGRDGCMKYAVLYGGRHTLGMIDGDPKIRKLSKHQFEKLKVSHESSSEEDPE